MGFDPGSAHLPPEGHSHLWGSIFPWESALWMEEPPSAPQLHLQHFDCEITVAL